MAGKNVTHVAGAPSELAVIGCGASGLAAAVTAARGGARVIILEKRSAVGGTSNFAEGLFAAESSLQRKKNMLVTKDQVFKMIMEYSHWQANPRLVRTVVDKSSETVEWLQQEGVEFFEPLAIYPGGLPTWHIIKGRGKRLCKILQKKAEEEGVGIHLGTRVKEFIMDDEGRVSGMVAETQDHGAVRVTTRAVVIATGGFANNKDMLEQYTRFGPEIITVPNIRNTGDGIRMGWSVGAAPKGTEVLQLYRPGVRGEGPSSHLNAAGRQPYLWVNQAGERFCEETVIFQWPWAGNALANQRGRVMYCVFDENTKRYMMEKGIDVGVGIMVPVTTKLVKLDKDLERGLKKNEAFVADTVKELAGAMGVDPDSLEATVQEYNAFCEDKRDSLFAKDYRYLHPVKRAKFYALRLYPTILGTLGGLKINHRAEVLNNRDQIIPGLYAVGNCAGGMYGDSYDLSVPGGTLGFAVNSGRIAGENVLKYIGK